MENKVKSEHPTLREFVITIAVVALLGIVAGAFIGAEVELVHLRRALHQAMRFDGDLGYCMTGCRTHEDEKCADFHEWLRSAR